MRNLISIARLSVVVGLLTGAWTHGQATMAQHAGHHHGSAQAPTYANPSSQDDRDIRRQPPHGGQVVAVGALWAELVHQSPGVRIYLYNDQQQPISAKGLGGTLGIQLPNDERIFPFALAFTQPSTEQGGQDYLAAAVDFSQVRESAVTTTAELTGVPGYEGQSLRLSQQLSLVKTPLRLEVSRATEADQAGIAQQRICPVMGMRLGDHGNPIKVQASSQTLYLCCKGCINKVQQNPDFYLAKAAQLRQGQ
jgi:hypothetical protein